jgi:type II secretory pathway pseudopilin PulG
VKRIKQFSWLIGIILLAFLLRSGWERYQENTRNKARRELAALRVAVESYATQNERYPTDGFTDWQSALLRPTTRPRLIGASLRDPFSAVGVPYRYSLSQSGRHFVIWSVGPDGLAGITGMNTDGSLQGRPGDDLYVLGGGDA